MAHDLSRPGVGLFLCQAISAGGDPALRDLVRTAAEWVWKTVSAQMQRPAGLYFGCFVRPSDL